MKVQVKSLFDPRGEVNIKPGWRLVSVISSVLAVVFVQAKDVLSYFWGFMLSLKFSLLAHMDVIIMWM